MTQIQLNINGAAYEGWQRINVVRSLEALAGRFEVEVTDKRPFPIPRGGFVELFLNENLIITGYTDSLEVGIDANSHTLRITGRDKTADLIDCSALVDSQEMNNASLQEIIEEVIAPFGINAQFEVAPSEVFKKFSFQQETSFEAIERACRLRGVFANSNEFGEIVIQQYGQKRAGDGLFMGKNILSARSTYNDQDRFSLYKVYGQQPGDDNTSPEASTGPEGEASDRGVSRYRPLIIMSEGAVDDALAQRRAEWEATVRAARAVSTNITVQGWEDKNGNLWRENTLARCYLPESGIDNDMLIKEVMFNLDNENGEKCSMVLVRPDAYQKQPDIEKEEFNSVEL